MKRIKQLRITKEDFDAINEFNKSIFKEFLDNSRELSPYTKAHYTSSLRLWFTWVKNNLDNKKHIEIKPREFMLFQNWMIDRGCSAGDIGCKRIAISSLNNYILTFYYDEFPLFRNFITKAIKCPPIIPVNEKNPLTKEEFNHLLEVLEEWGEWQKIAYLKFTFDTGCRRSESRQVLKEIINAKPITKEKDGKKFIYYETHKIRCKGRGSIGKIRTFAFSQPTMDALRKWIDNRGIDNCEYMFITKRVGKIQQLHPDCFNYWCQFIFSKIVQKRVHPHLLRSSRATTLSEEDGVDIKVIQKLLGHEDVSTTQRYIIRDDSEDLLELYAN